METNLPNTQSGDSGRSGPLTRGQRLAVRRRERKLNQVAALKAAGMSEARAAKRLRLNLKTIWNWRRRIVPAFERCGRKPAIARFTIPNRLISKVQRLVIAGCSKEKAWRTVAGVPGCPNELAEFLRTAPTIPASFFDLSKLTRLRATVLVGKNFTHVPLTAPC